MRRTHSIVMQLHTNTQVVWFHQTRTRCPLSETIWRLKQKRHSSGLMCAGKFLWVLKRRRRGSTYKQLEHTKNASPMLVRLRWAQHLHHWCQVKASSLSTKKNMQSSLLAPLSDAWTSLSSHTSPYCCCVRSRIGQVARRSTPERSGLRLIPVSGNVDEVKAGGKAENSGTPGVTWCAGGMILEKHTESLKHLEPKHAHWMKCEATRKLCACVRTVKCNLYSCSPSWMGESATLQQTVHCETCKHPHSLVQ